MKHGLFERSWTNCQREWLTTSVSPLTLPLPPQNQCQAIAYSWWLTLNLLSWNLKRYFFAKALCLPSLREPVKEEDTEISTQRSLWEVSTDGGLPCLAVLGGAVGVVQLGWKNIVEFRGYVCICTHIYIIIYIYMHVFVYMYVYMSNRKNPGNTKYVFDGHWFMEIDGKW
jgi:hypothetical protein